MEGSKIEIVIVEEQVDVIDVACDLSLGLVNEQTISSLSEMSRDSEHAVKKLLKDLSKAPAPKQLAVGAGAGWMAGYITMKVGKAVATTIGGTLLVLQLAHHKGYIQVDWNRMSSDSNSLADRIKNKLKIRSKSGIEKFMDYSKKNIYVAGGFTAGFFMGLAAS